MNEQLAPDTNLSSGGDESDAPAESQAAEKKQRRRIFFAMPKEVKVYQSTHRSKLRDQLKADGLNLGDVNIVYGSPREVRSKTDFTF